MEPLTQNSHSIIAPGFTTTFRQTGLYHKLYSTPNMGNSQNYF